jgi:hypothetical protein
MHQLVSVESIVDQSIVLAEENLGVYAALCKLLVHGILYYLKEGMGIVNGLSL